MPKIKRHFYNNKEYKLDDQNQVLILSKDFHEKLKNKKLWGKFGFKKIGGSNIAEILEVDNFKSPFKAFVRMCWLDVPIIDKKYVKAGISIEPKVIELLEKQPNVKEIERFPAEKYNYDYFPNNKIFGGLPDGIIKPLNILLEVKTTNVKNKESWEKFGVPQGYLKQSELYTYMLGLEKFALVATFLEDGDYLDLDNYPISKRTTRTWFLKLNKSRTEDDMKFATDWYNHYTNSGISPKFSVQKDLELIEFLKCSNEKEWDELIDKWDKAGKINWESLKNE